ncbi:E3 ubiquitin-protein ligase DZIP3-like, partial [Stylophora pistillata]|uniref:E3 ubiquitin-protein ligase DZIP3-like n=1 Tax=Stylophora pistillata TaxID=50429 RepID=UPI000C04D5B2
MSISCLTDNPGEVSFMATALAPFASTKETTNYARLCRLLVDVGSQVLRSTFDNIHPPATLQTVLGSTSVHHATLQSLYRGRNKVLNPTQWGKLYPTHSPVSSATFDITLLTVLLRNICGLSPPATGWDRLPPAANISIADDIVRVRFYRNTVYGHASQASVDDLNFGSYWQEIREALVRLGGAHFREDIDNLEYDCMDPDIEEHYRELMKQWKKDDENIKAKLEEIEDSLGKMRHHLKDTTEKIQIEMKEMKEKLGSLITTAEKRTDE